MSESGIVDPYKLLSRVSDGGRAMEAFEELIGSADLKESYRLEIKTQLLEFCRLDTLSMVVIFNYLKSRCE